MPEFFLIFGVLTLLSIFVFYSHNTITSGPVLGIQINKIGIFLLLSAFMLYMNVSSIQLTAFTGGFVRDPISFYLLGLAIIGTSIICVLSLSYLAKNSLYEYEFFLVLILTLLGLILIVSSNDFLYLYIGIELQSLGLYILATMKTNSTFSTEAGLKYFVLGAFASSLLIFGIVIFYGMTGLVNFDDVYFFLSTLQLEHFFITKGVILSLFFIFASLIFKIGGAPFHMWVPDVYEGVSSIVTAFFSIVPKLGILSVLIKFLFIFYHDVLSELNSLFLCCSILSVFIGSVGALGQNRIKRILSYSAIAHSGFLLFGLCTGSLEGLVSVSMYIFVYYLLIISLFSCLLAGQQKESASIIKIIGNLGFLYKSNFFLSICFIFALFSIAGVPPLSGFYSKLLIFVSGITEGFWFVTLVLILLSVVSSVYYLRLIRSVTFVSNKKRWLLLENIGPSHSYVISLTLFLNLFFCSFGGTLLYSFYNQSLLFVV